MILAGAPRRARDDTATHAAKEENGMKAAICAPLRRVDGYLPLEDLGLIGDGSARGPGRLAEDSKAFEVREVVAHRGGREILLLGPVALVPLELLLRGRR
jgi:hypothetical protein